jgi:hypothetical protein
MSLAVLDRLGTCVVFLVPLQLIIYHVVRLHILVLDLICVVFPVFAVKPTNLQLQYNLFCPLDLLVNPTILIYNLPHLLGLSCTVFLVPL